jgi:hypothetical protein
VRLDEEERVRSAGLRVDPAEHRVVDAGEPPAVRGERQGHGGSSQRLSLVLGQPGDAGCGFDLRQRALRAQVQRMRGVAGFGDQRRL